MGSPPPILLQQMGVRYELRLTKKRSLRRSLVNSSRTDEQGNFWALREINLRIEPGESCTRYGLWYAVPIAGAAPSGRTERASSTARSPSCS